MLRLLLPVDGSSGSDRAVRMAVKLYRDVTPVRIHLLHVLPHDDGIALDPSPSDGAASKNPGDGNRGLSSARALLDGRDTLCERCPKRIRSVGDHRVRPRDGVQRHRDGYARHGVHRGASRLDRKAGYSAFRCPGDARQVDSPAASAEFDSLRGPAAEDRAGAM